MSLLRLSKEVHEGGDINELMSRAARKKKSREMGKATNVKKRKRAAARSAKKTLSTDKALTRSKAKVIKKLKDKFKAGAGSSIASKERAEKKIKKMSSKVDRLAKKGVKGEKKKHAAARKAKSSKKESLIIKELEKALTEEGIV